jgi:hypothetical protein
VRLFSRNGTDLTKRFPFVVISLAEALHPGNGTGLHTTQTVLEFGECSLTLIPIFRCQTDQNEIRCKTLFATPANVVGSNGVKLNPWKHPRNGGATLRCFLIP